MCGAHVCGSRKRRDLSHRLSCLAAKMKRMEMQLWLWDHLSPSSVHGWNKLLSLVSFHTHSALLRRRRWCWHQAKEQLIEIFPNGWSIVCVDNREKALVMPSQSIFISSGQSEIQANECRLKSKVTCFILRHQHCKHHSHVMQAALIFLANLLFDKRCQQS